MDLAYTIRRSSRSKHVRILVRPSGTVLVTAPKRVSERWVHAFVAEKAEWIHDAIARLAERRQTLPPEIATDSYAHYLRFKERARALAHRKVKQWNAVYGFAVQSIRVKRTRTRWGSCSAGGNLNFNYKILFLSEELQDYLVIHELCHLAHLDHSARFWALVARACPRHREHRRVLARLG